MKFVIVVFCCFLAAFRETAGVEVKLPPEVVELLKGLSETCKEETGLDSGLAAELHSGKFSGDPKAKCYAKCMMMHTQALTEDGNLDVDLIEASMPEVIKSHGGMEAVHKCKHIHEDDLCETAYQLMVCFKKENPDLYILFE